MATSLPARVTAHDDASRLRDLFERYARSRDRKLRNELVEAHIGLARHLTARYAGRGEQFEDLLQVAMLGMVKAVERFDPSRNIQFSTFASVTVTGELRRHFRDRTWSVRVPRRAQELHLRIAPVSEALAQRLGRTPRPDELATELDVTTDELLQAMDVGRAYRSSSLDSFEVSEGDAAGDGGRRAGKALAQLDGGFDAVERSVEVERLLATLPARERRMIELRFYEERTQLEIASELGISQMHVSRLLRRTLDALHDATHERSALAATSS